VSTSPPSFVHLRVHSEYSIVDSVVRIDALVDRAKADGQPALALTDSGNLFGLVKFYRAARGKGIKPIAGCDVWITNDEERDKPWRLLLLARDHAGYRNLCELLSQAWLTNQHRGRGEIRREWFVEQGAGLIALSGARAGEVGQALEHGNLPAAERAAQAWAALFPGAFYIELQRTRQDGNEMIVQGSLRLAIKLGLPVVATHPVQFLEPDDFRAHEARVCIAEGEILANPRRVKRFTPDQYFKSQAEMAELFADIPAALANTLEIAKRCSLRIELGKSKLPQFPTPEGVGLDDYMVQLSYEGLERRLEQLFPNVAERDAKRPVYAERLRIECDTILAMGFPGYFLIVQDFINWAKGNGVPVGPGRGSGAGSLVAYSLGITDLDPLPYDLLFERFLNPERVSMPDFDIDFCQDNRYKVIEYVRAKYGPQAVSQIATFGTMASKAVIRDVGRVLDLPYNFCDGLSKLIPVHQNKPLSLADARKQEPILAEREQKEDEVRELLALAEPLEDIARNVGMHAGGVLIAPGKLTDFCPLYSQSGAAESVVSQYDKDDVEAVGLVKFDFLGLRNLTILDWAVRYVRRFNPQMAEFDVNALKFDDPGVYKLLSDANTTAIFQLESRGMKELLKKLKPSTFEDIIAVLALYRPGPLGSGMVDDFINRKHGKASVDYFHPLLEPVLKPTYGVIVYQEQVMQIAQKLAGYTLGGADLLRRAMGKKKAEEMAKQREIFTTGAVGNGIDQTLATQLFDLMEKFAEYGFNKSHTAAYAVVAYQTAWLKAHHPAEFIAATLSSDMDDTDKVQIFYGDALANAVTVLPPDINASPYRFEPVLDEHSAKGKPPRTIRYGLGAVKGTGEAAVEEIVRIRQETGPFADLFDFCRRVDKRIVNRRAIEALIKAGAFDSLLPERAVLLASVSKALDAADQAERAASQVSLFGDGEASLEAPELAKAVPWTERQRLTEEKAALGYYFSGHLFTAYAGEVRRFVKKPLSDLQPSQEKQWLAGILSQVRTQMTRRGKMLFAVLDDGSAQIEVSIFNELYEQHRAKLREDELLIILGKVSYDDYSGNNRIVAESLYDLQGAREANAKLLRVKVNGEANAQRLNEWLHPFRAGADGGIPVEIHYAAATASCAIRLPQDWLVRIPETLFDRFEQSFPQSAVELVY
jgi:DNA polymerase-3 subunit alpha